MKKYIIVFPSNTFSAFARQKLLSMNHFELYPNVFFVKCDYQEAKNLYSFLQITEGTNENMVVQDVTNSNYWGYASKELWTWLESD